VLTPTLGTAARASELLPGTQGRGSERMASVGFLNRHPSSSSSAAGGRSTPFQVLAPGLALGVIAGAIALSLLALSSALVLVAIVASLLAVRVVFHPPTAAYVLLLTTPLIVGVDRGLILPLLRPSEALGLLLGGALLARGLIRLGTGHRPSFRLSTVDATILLLAFTSSVLPLLWMIARSRDVTLDDLLYSLTLWKFYGLYLIVRVSVRAYRARGAPLPRPFIGRRCSRGRRCRAAVPPGPGRARAPGHVLRPLRERAGSDHQPGHRYPRFVARYR
jgi:hypothetical protein